MPSEQQLSDVLSEFARTLVTDFPIQGILDRLVQRIVDVLPITAAGVTLIAPGLSPRYLAASNNAAFRFEQLQTELGQGPCVEAYLTGEAVAIPDLRSDARFPEFSRRAVQEGLAAVFTFPLRNGRMQLGALDIYRDEPGPLTARTLAAAQTLADVAAAYLLNAQARADLQASSDRSRETSLHDPLTGLPNRVLLLERLGQALLRGGRTGHLTAVLFADLDQFKAVNDMYGHSVGDELLIAVASRVTRQLRPTDSVARLSGDEFVILCEDLVAASDAEVIAARVGEAIARPFKLSVGQVEATVSIGMALSDREDDLPEDLLHSADSAMYQAKRKGGAGHQVVDLAEQRLVDERVSLRHDLRRACKEGQLRTVYQPIVRTADGRITGVEALVRWDHPLRGPVPPSTLIPLAEQSGIITEIGQWVLERACLDRHRWAHHVPDDFEMAVNVSAYQLMSPGFAETVANVLRGTGTDAGVLTLEVTESVFIQDSERAMVVFGELKLLGVKLALDDFGTGYCALSYLRQFPVDIVKIDQGFVATLGADASSAAIVAAVVELAHLLGLSVVAEGIETVAQHDQVAALHCDSSQGYYFARPMAADAMDELMSAGAGGVNPRLPVPAETA